VQDHGSRRAESGKAISIENPSFVAGSAGGEGCAICGEPAPCPVTPRDHVSALIASLLTAGRSQALRVPTVVVSDFIGCIVISALDGRQTFYGMGSGMARQRSRHGLVRPQ
jgi:hypothetical protein